MDDEIHVLGGTVVLSSDFRESKISEKESYTAEDNKNLVMTKKEREDLILTIRNKIIEDKIILDLEDTVIDYYNIREIDMNLH